MLNLAEVQTVESFVDHIKGEKLTIPAYKPEVLDWLEALADKLETVITDAEYRSDVQQSAYQAIVNAFVHGSKMNRTKSIELTTEITDSSLSISMVDEGEGFDIDILTNPEKGAEYAFGGRQGIFIIRKVAEEVLFLKEGNGVLMRFKIT